MKILSTVEELKGLTGKGLQGRDLATEAAAMLASFLAGQGNCTVHLTKDNATELFYSSLPEDEAEFWKCPLCAAKERSLERKGSRVFPLPEMERYDGFLIFEGIPGKEPPSDEDLENLLWLFQLFWCMCLLSDEVRTNYLTDPLTGLPEITIFRQAVGQKITSGQDGHLIAARVPVHLERPFSEKSLDNRMQELAGYCKEMGDAKAYRIAADIIAILADGEKERALDHMQKIMLLLPETSLFLCSYAFLEKGRVLTRIQEEMSKIEAGGTVINTALVTPKLPVFVKSTTREVQNGKT